VIAKFSHEIPARLYRQIHPTRLMSQIRAPCQQIHPTRLQTVNRTGPWRHEETNSVSVGHLPKLHDEFFLTCAYVGSACLSGVELVETLGDSFSMFTIEGGVVSR